MLFLIVLKILVSTIVFIYVYIVAQV